jgi:hypothetical protein
MATIVLSSILEMNVQLSIDDGSLFGRGFLEQNLKR